MKDELFNSNDLLHPTYNTTVAPVTPITPAAPVTPAAPFETAQAPPVDPVESAIAALDTSKTTVTGTSKENDVRYVSVTNRKGESYFVEKKYIRLTS